MRCDWAGDIPEMVDYHDREWGVPQHDDSNLFEFLTLEGAQAGLSWLTILRKRAGYRQAFGNFNVKLISGYGQGKIDELLANPGIIRNRLKILSTIRNAAAVLEIQAEYGSFDAYLWQFIDGIPRQNSWNSISEIPAETAESKAMSRDLLSRGFKFVGPTICYAFMQAVGMVNDHTCNCFRYREVSV